MWKTQTKVAPFGVSPCGPTVKLNGGLKVFSRKQTKRLAQGRFHFARATEEGATHIEVEATELALMLEGIDLTGAKRHKRWRPGEEIRTEVRRSRGLGLSNPPRTTIHRAA